MIKGVLAKPTHIRFSCFTIHHDFTPVIECILQIYILRSVWNSLTIFLMCGAEVYGWEYQLEAIGLTCTMENSQLKSVLYIGRNCKTSVTYKDYFGDLEERHI